jgi:hypothetical protein
MLVSFTCEVFLLEERGGTLDNLITFLRMVSLL